MAIPQPPHGVKITSVNNQYVKHCVRLRENRRYREQVGRVILPGETLLKELTESPLASEVAVHTVVHAPGISIPLGDQENVAEVEVAEHVFKKIVGLDSVEGMLVAAEVDLPWQGASLEGVPVHRLLALDAVQDPGNMGNLIRTAAAFGWNGVYLLERCCDPFNDKALRASRGGVFQIPLIQGSWTLLEDLSKSKGIIFYAGDANSQDVGSLSIHDNQAICLLLGSEGQGLSPSAKQICKTISIPMKGNMESLNVAVAGGILMYALQ